MRLRGVAPFGLVLGGLLCLAPGAAAVPAQMAIDQVNTVRTANGLSALTEDREMSLGCRLHARYMTTATHYRPGPGFLPHIERPTEPNHTALGEVAAGLSALAPGEGSPQYIARVWASSHNLWEAAPQHMRSLLEPDATTAWYGDFGAAACMGVGSTGPATALAPFYSVPGDGTSGYPTAETLGPEWPHNPAELLGLPLYKPVGPVLYVFSTRGSRMRAAELTGPEGVVTTRTSPGFVFIPKPLRPDTRYSVRVEWRIEGLPDPEYQVFSFTTGEGPRLPALQGPQDPKVRVTYLGRSGPVVRVRIDPGLAAGQPLALSTRLYRCQKVTVPFCRPAGPARKRTLTLPGPLVQRIRVAPTSAVGGQSLELGVQVKPFTANGVPYRKSGAGFLRKL